jgi:hypothetical protein
MVTRLPLTPLLPVTRENLESGSKVDASARSDPARGLRDDRHRAGSPAREAGHAVAAILTRRSVTLVSIGAGVSHVDLVERLTRIADVVQGSNTAEFGSRRWPTTPSARLRGAQ